MLRHKSRHKKAEVDGFIEFLVVMGMLAIIFFAIFSASKWNQNKMIEKITSLKHKSNANNILNQYLQQDIKQCIESSDNEAKKELLEKDNLRYLDLIYLMLQGSPKNSITSEYFTGEQILPGYSIENNLEKVFEKKEEDYAGFTSLWDECTTKFLTTLFLNSNQGEYEISVSFNHDTHIISRSKPSANKLRYLNELKEDKEKLEHIKHLYPTMQFPVFKDYTIIAQSKLPNNEDRNDILTINLYKVEDSK
jgi:hypothetical protein